jgi:hypothetical protein
MEQRKEKMEKAASSNEPVTMRRITEFEGPVSMEEMRTIMQSQPMMGAPARAWQAETAGIMSIIAGAWNLVIGLATILVISTIQDFIASLGFTGTVSSGIGWALLALGVIAIVGGSLALMRRMWGLALVGAIAAVFPSPAIIPTLLGTMALIFVVLGKPSFRHM